MRLRQLKISNSITSRDSISITRYLQEIGKIKTITPEEETRLCQNIKKGDKQALDTLVKANLRFVVSVAKQYQGFGLSLSDMVNEGNIGLIKAARKFDETKGFRFISFAVWWIRQEIVQALSQQSDIIRMPMNKRVLLNRIKKERVAMEQELNRTPDPEEIAEMMNLPASQVSELLAADEKTVSLDTPLNDDDESGSLHDVLTSNDPDVIETTICHRQSLTTELSRHFRLLNKRQKETLYGLFGLGDQQELSIEALSRKFDLTPERVRQIREKALQILRTNCNFQTLRSYL